MRPPFYKQSYSKFYFSPSDKKGMVALTIVILFLLAFIVGLKCCSSGSQPSAAQLQADSIEIAQFIAEMDSLRQLEKARYETDESDSPSQQHQKHTAPERFAFDPNLADSATFARLGLPAWMIRNIIKYRSKGGFFDEKDDFSRIYGLKQEEFLSLRPYIQIQSKQSYTHQAQTMQTREAWQNQTLQTQTSPADSLSRQQLYLPADSSLLIKQEKYPPGTLVDLNRADTTELKKIPGIGSTIARMMVAYREQLGGYYQLEQLKEIRIRHQLLTDWLTIDTTCIKRIMVNRAGFRKLERHPYISAYQAKAFLDYHHRHGNIPHLKVFALDPNFNEEDFERLSHYLSFEP